MTTTHAPHHQHQSQPWRALIPFAAALLVVAVVGGLAASSASSVYADLDKPGFAPPSWLFGPAWTVLYVMIAIAGWRYWAASRRFDVALSAYAVQLVLNASWTPLFFAGGLYGVALIEIVVLATSIVATIVLFSRRSRVAAWLLAPYLAWVVFASALNLEIWRLN